MPSGRISICLPSSGADENGDFDQFWTEIQRISMFIY
jgi:hypothetical protein